MQDDIVTRWLTREDIAHRTVSYAQNCEDVLLDRVFGRHHAGFYVDVGANDPVFHSVTKLLYERGWRGINIEPTPVLHRQLVADRPGDVNLNLGISDAAGTLTFFEVAPPLHGWSTFHPAVAASYRDQHNVFPTERPIPVTTLGLVFEEHVGDRTVDVLKIDAEGFEKQVVSSIDLREWRPRVILIESTWADYWEHMILGADYTTAAYDGINRYYVRAEDRGLLPAFVAPVNNLDNYIPHEFVRLLELELASITVPAGSKVDPGAKSEDESFGPTILGIAHRLRNAADRHPGLASMAKRLLRLVG